MPSASVSTATAVKPGFFSNWRKAKRRSFMVGRSWSVVSDALFFYGVVATDIFDAARLETGLAGILPAP